MIQFSNQTTFAGLNDQYFKARLPSIARNDTTSFVAVKVVNRLDGKELEAFIDGLVPLVPNLLATFDESVKHVVDASNLVKAIADTSNTDGIFTVNFKMLKISEKELQHASEDAINNVTGAGSCSKGKKIPYTNARVAADTVNFTIYWGTAVDLPMPDTVLHLATHPTASHIIPHNPSIPYFATRHSSPLGDLLSGNFAQLAMSPQWVTPRGRMLDVTQGMNNYRAGIVKELFRSEGDVRASLFGRIVWRNWAMDSTRRAGGTGSDWARVTRTQSRNTKALLGS
ncbi:hypothetical protein BGX38DRAFT_1143672 [Terfezia claveryi]|nr:hypothetical protein BGX38DRAFT_1143672 [Terfezia claveryi]